MTVFFEIETGHSVNIDALWHLEVVGDTVVYYANAAGPMNTVIVDYGSPEAATEKYDEFITTANRNTFIRDLMISIGGGMFANDQTLDAAHRSFKVTANAQLAEQAFDASVAGANRLEVET